MAVSGNQGLAALLKVISFSPGFSPVLNGKVRTENRFNGFYLLSLNKTVKTVSLKCDGPFTGLKPGENEKTFAANQG